jgi:hypothetical protein
LPSAGRFKLFLSGLNNFVDPLVKLFPEALPIKKQIEHIYEFVFKHVQKQIRFRVARGQGRQNGIGHPFSYFHFIQPAKAI